METVTIAASRGFTVSDMEMLVGSAIVLAVLAWMVFSKLRQLRGRHQEPRV
jgi:ABC-type nickel/cobalt efflux system permease component RcnA